MKQTEEKKEPKRVGIYDNLPRHRPTVAFGRKKIITNNFNSPKMTAERYLKGIKQVVEKEKETVTKINLIPVITSPKSKQQSTPSVTDLDQSSEENGTTPTRTV